MRIPVLQVRFQLLFNRRFFIARTSIINVTSFCELQLRCSISTKYFIQILIIFLGRFSPFPNPTLTPHLTTRDLPSGRCGLRTVPLQVHLRTVPPRPVKGGRCIFELEFPSSPLPRNDPHPSHDYVRSVISDDLNILPRTKLPPPPARDAPGARCSRGCS